MKYLEIDGVRVSAIGLGTWQFASREWGYGAAYAAHQAPAMVRRALELGVTLIDTAEIYGFGESERIIALVGLPFVLAYTLWVYRTFRGPVRLDEHSY